MNVCISNKQQMRDLLTDRGELLSRFSQEAEQALDDQRAVLVTEVTSEVRRRDEQEDDFRTVLSLHVQHAEDVSPQPNQGYAGVHQHLTGLVAET